VQRRNAETTACDSNAAIAFLVSSRYSYKTRKHFRFEHFKFHFRFRKMPKLPPANYVCYQCNQPGHWKKDCTKSAYAANTSEAALPDIKDLASCVFHEEKLVQYRVRVCDFGKNTRVGLSRFYRKEEDSEWLPSKSHVFFPLDAVFELCNLFDVKRAGNFLGVILAQLDPNGASYAAFEERLYRHRQQPGSNAEHCQQRRDEQQDSVRVLCKFNTRAFAAAKHGHEEDDCEPAWKTQKHE
jgi:hypothetical protein